MENVEDNNNKNRFNPFHISFYVKVGLTCSHYWADLDMGFAKAYVQILAIVISCSNVIKAL